jgi:hypothetical protein
MCAQCGWQGSGNADSLSWCTLGIKGHGSLHHVRIICTFLERFYTSPERNYSVSVGICEIAELVHEIPYVILVHNPFPLLSHIHTALLWAPTLNSGQIASFWGISPFFSLKNSLCTHAQLETKTQHFKGLKYQLQQKHIRVSEEALAIELHIRHDIRPKSIFSFISN